MRGIRGNRMTPLSKAQLGDVVFNGMKLGKLKPQDILESMLEGWTLHRIKCRCHLSNDMYRKKISLTIVSKMHRAGLIAKAGKSYVDDSNKFKITDKGREALRSPSD